MSDQFSDIRLITDNFPKATWEMKLGDLTMTHIKPINWWQRFWLRFMGWEVNVYEKDDES